MTTEANPTPTGREPVHTAEELRQPALRQMPGLVAVSLYMVLLAAADVYFVVTHRIGYVYLIFSAFFVAAAFGLLMLFRWAWALTLAAVALLSAICLRAFFMDHSLSALQEGLVNLVIFLYLVRIDLRSKLH
jgi:hypothetical protein